MRDAVMFIWAVVLLGCLFHQPVYSAKTITGLSVDTFHSCDFANLGLQFKITGTELGGSSCAFRREDTGEITAVSGTDLTTELLCGFSSPLTFGVYSVGIKIDDILENIEFGNEEDLDIFYSEDDAATYAFYTVEDLTVVASPVDLPSTVVSPIFNNFQVAKPLDFLIYPLSDCGSPARCDEGGQLKFAFAFDGHPELVVSLDSEVDGTCAYSLNPIYTKGSYDLVISYNGTTIEETTFEVAPDITQLNQSQAVIGILGVDQIAGAQSCLNVTLYDSYGNTIENVMLAQFSMLWQNGNTTTSVQNKTLGEVVDGQYILCFMPTKSGTQYLSIQISGVPLNGSPVAILVQPGPLYAQYSQIRSATVCPSSCASPTPSVTAVSGVPFSFTIVPRDRYQNTISSPSESDLPSFTGQISKSGGPNNSATFSIEGNYFRATFTPLVAAQYTFSAFFDGEVLDTGSTPTVTVTPGPVSLAHSTVNTTHQTLRAGGSFYVDLLARDENDNLVVGATGWTAKLDGSLTCPVTELGSGYYRATCSPTVASDHTLTFYLQDVAHSSNVSVTVLPGGVSASQSYFGDFEPTMACNSSGTFKIYAHDSYGNVGGVVESFQKFQTQIQIVQNGITLARYSTNVATLVDGSDSVYEVSYFLVTSGNYTITVLFNGSPMLSQVPPHIFVNPGSTLATQCTLEVASSQIAGFPVYFDLIARDSFDNIQVIDETPLFTVTATNSLTSAQTACTIGAPSPVTHIYNVTCSLTSSGPYQVLGTYNGSPIVGAAIDLVPGPISATTSSFASISTGQTTTIAGETTTIIIQGRDAVQNRLTFAADYNVTITSQGRRRSVIVPEKVINDAQGTAGLSYYSYSIVEAGRYTVSVLVDGAHISGSPANLRVHSAPAVPSTVQFNAGATFSFEGLVGDTIQIRVYLKDPYGNDISGLDVITASLTGTDFVGVSTTTPTLTSDGYLLSFPVTVGGVYKLNLIVNGSPLENNVTVAAFSTLGGKCTNFDGPINQGNVWTLVCTSYDVYGKEKITGGDVLTWEAPDAEVTVIDHKDGQYSVKYMSQAIGSHSFVLHINDKQVEGMPYQSTIIPGAVVLGTVIPTIFVFALLGVCVVFYLRRKREKEQLLLKRKRKPQQIFKPIDEGEWMDDDMEQEEGWFEQRDGVPADLTEKMNNAHNRVMSELELH